MTKDMTAGVGFQSGAMQPGTLVRHVTRQAWGLGKVVLTDGASVWIYFKGRPGATPESRVVELSQGTDKLLPVERTQDTELEHLPPYANGKFSRTATSMTFEKARNLFQRAYSLGFGDPKYLGRDGERP